MTIEQTSAFNSLLAAWREHQDNRTRGAEISDLHSSHMRLAEARLSTRF